MALQPDTLFAALAHAAGWISADDLKQALKDYKSSKGPMPEFLLQAGMLDQAGIDALLAGRCKSGASKHYNFGDVAILQKFCSQQRVQEFLQTQQELLAKGEKLLLGELMMREGVVKPHQVQFILTRQDELNAQPESKKKARQDWVQFREDSRLQPGDAVPKGKIVKQLSEDMLGSSYLAASADGKQRWVLRKFATQGDQVRTYLGALNLRVKGLLPQKLSGFANVHPFQKLDSNHWALKMQYVKGVSCANRVQKEGPLPWREAIRILQKVADILATLQQDDSPHGCLDAHQVVLHGKDDVKILNLPLWKPYPFSLDIPWTAPDTHPSCIAPEIVLPGGKMQASTDSFSLAGLLYYLLHGTPIASGNSPLQCLLQLALDDAPSLQVEGLPEGLDMLYKAMLHPDPEQRPTPTAIAKTLAPIVESNKTKKHKAGASSSQKLDSTWMHNHAAKASRQIASSAQRPSDLKEKSSNAKLIIAISLLAGVLAIAGIFAMSGGNDKPTLQEFDEPSGSYQVKIEYYDGMIKGSEFSERSTQARQRRDAIQSDMDRKANLIFTEMKNDFDALQNSKEYEALTERLRDSTLKQFYTSEWQGKFSRLAAKLKQVIQQDLDSLANTVNELRAQKKLKKAQQLLRSYDGCDHPELRQLASDLAKEIKQEISGIDRAARAEAKREAYTRSQVAYDAWFQNSLNPALQALDFKSAATAIQIILKDNASALVRDHLKQVQTWQDDVALYLEMMKEFHAHADMLGSEGVSIWHQGSYMQFHKTNLNQPWLGQSLPSNTEITIEFQELPKPQQAHCIAMVLSQSENEDALRAAMQWLQKSGEITEAVRLLRGLQAVGHATDSLMDLPSLRIDIQQWAQRPPALSKNDLLLQWIDRVRGLNWKGLLTDNELASLYDQQTRMSLSDWTTASNVEVFPLTKYIDAKTTPGMKLQAIPGGIRIDAPGTWTLQQDVSQFGLLFSSHGQETEFEFAFANIKLGAGTRDGLLRWSIREGGSFEQMESKNSIYGWHSLEMLSDDKGYSILLDGKSLYQSKSPLSKDASKTLEISLTSRNPLDLSDILITPGD